MHGTVRVALFLFLLAGAGCTTTGTTPATTPPSIAPVTTAVPGTVVTTTTSTTVATTTTTIVDRLTEIAAIFENLEKRRLQAIFDQDEEAFRAVHANKEYLEESLVVLDLAKVTDPLADLHQVAISLVADNENCIGAVLTRDYADVLEGGGESTSTYIAELAAGGWGLSWVGEGWECDGTHPLS